MFLDARLKEITYRKDLPNIFPINIKSKKDRQFQHDSSTLNKRLKN